MFEHWKWFVLPLLIALALEYLVRRYSIRQRRRRCLAAWALMSLLGAGPLVSLSSIVIGLHASDPQFPYSAADVGFFAVTVLMLTQCLRTGILILGRSRTTVARTPPKSVNT